MQAIYLEEEQGASGNHDPDCDRRKIDCVVATADVRVQRNAGEESSTAHQLTGHSPFGSRTTLPGDRPSVEGPFLCVDAHDNRHQRGNRKTEARGPLE